MKGVTFHDYLMTSYHYLLMQQEVCEELWGLSNFENWADYEDSCELCFSNPGGSGSQLIARYQVVGSLSLDTGQWTWAWDNAFVPYDHYCDVVGLKHLGEEKSWDKLTRSFREAGEEDAWQMTALAGYYLGAKGAYRIPISENQFAFVLFTNLSSARRA